MSITESDLRLDGGGTLHVYDTGGSDTELVVLWHHGTPNIGTPPEPLFETGDELGIRWIGYDRPGYGTSTRQPDRDVASTARLAAVVADRLDVGRFAVMSHSGGGTYAIAAAALLPERVTAVLAAATLAPLHAPGLDYFAGMGVSGVAALSTAAQGRAAKEGYEGAEPEYDPEFTAADEAAFGGPWGWFGPVVRAGAANGPEPGIDDDLAYTKPWGVDPADVRAPVLLLHGEDDRIAPIGHAEWLAGHCRTAELRRFAGEGHISVLTRAGDGLRWLAQHG